MWSLTVQAIEQSYQDSDSHGDVLPHANRWITKHHRVQLPFPSDGEGGWASFVDTLSATCSVVHLGGVEGSQDENLWSWWTNHFSHPFLGTYEVVQFLELGNLKGTHPRVVYELHTNPLVSWDANPIPYPSLSKTRSPHTIPFHLIPYHTILCHTIPSFETCHRVSGVLFTKYKKYFCRLQYWSIRLHFLWTGSLDFFWHFKLQVEAIGWTLSFEHQLNCALSQLLAICTLNLAIYTLHNPSQAT